MGRVHRYKKKKRVAASHEDLHDLKGTQMDNPIESIMKDEQPPTRAEREIMLRMKLMQQKNKKRKEDIKKKKEMKREMLVKRGQDPVKEQTYKQKLAQRDDETYYQFADRIFQVTALELEKREENETKKMRSGRKAFFERKKLKKKLKRGNVHSQEFLDNMQNKKNDTTNPHNATEHKNQHQQTSENPLYFEDRKRKRNQEKSAFKSNPEAAPKKRRVQESQEDNELKAKITTQHQGKPKTFAELEDVVVFGEVAQAPPRLENLNRAKRDKHKKKKVLTPEQLALKEQKEKKRAEMEHLAELVREQYRMSKLRKRERMNMLNQGPMQSQ